MTKLPEIKYGRPDLDKLKIDFKATLAEFTNAGGFASAKVAVEKLNDYLIDVNSYAMLASYRHTIDTRDKFYDDEQDFWDENSPYVADLETELAKAILASPYRDDLVADGDGFLAYQCPNCMKIFYSHDKPRNVAKPDACAQLYEGWRDRSDKSYYNEKRILIFTPCYEDITMRWRIIDSQFMDLCTEASHWKKLDEPAFI